MNDPPPMSAPRLGPIRSVCGWAFRNRRTGRITVAQFPNSSLGIFLVASVIRRLVNPTDTPRVFLDWLVTVSLVWWALDEIIRGVNPWRRFLGATVLIALAISHAIR